MSSIVAYKKAGPLPIRRDNDMNADPVLTDAELISSARALDRRNAAGSAANHHGIDRPGKGALKTGLGLFRRFRCRELDHILDGLGGSILPDAADLDFKWLDRAKG